jgi:hypothetical protein
MSNGLGTSLGVSTVIFIRGSVDAKSGVEKAQIANFERTKNRQRNGDNTGVDASVPCQTHAPFSNDSAYGSASFIILSKRRTLLVTPVDRAETPRGTCG